MEFGLYHTAFFMRLPWGEWVGGGLGGNSFLKKVELL
jgi:hypothetical protein